MINELNDNKTKCVNCFKDNESNKKEEYTKLWISLINQIEKKNNS